MARPESVAVAGYFPTPQNVAELISDYLESTRDAVFADPCAGDGAAILTVATRCGGGKIYTCEMEAQRYKGLVERFNGDWHARQQAVHGDAFRLEISRGVGVLLLNPPYDIDPVHGRLEQRFLERFTAGLSEDGILVFIVPYYALAASAEIIAREYSDVTCYRFPVDQFDVFKQVVLFAKKSPTRLAPDARILEQVRAWSKSVTRVPILGVPGDKYQIPGTYSTTWRLREFDLQGLIKKLRPWRETKAKGLSFVPHVIPETPVEDLLFRTFEVATALRPAHIAAGIASGLLNGRPVTSDTKGMPPLLVKGVFDREYVTIEEKRDKKGKVTSVVQVQQPKLSVTVLNLETHRYTTLKVGESKGARSIDQMTIEDLLEHYKTSLMKVMEQQCPVLYSPKRDAERLPLSPVDRDLYRAQMHAAKALYHLLGGPAPKRRGRRRGPMSQHRRGLAAILLGEIGCGKTATVLAVAKTIAKRMLVLCPPHLLRSWSNEIATVLPEAEVRILETMADVDALEQIPSDQIVIAILSREAAKLGHSWAEVTEVEHKGCPRCGAPLPKKDAAGKTYEPGDLAKKRICCEARPLSARDDIARAAMALALRVAPSSPTDGNARALLAGRHVQGYLSRFSENAQKWTGFDSKWVDATINTVVDTLLSGFQEAYARLLGELLIADYQPEKIAAIVRQLVVANKDESRYFDLARALTCLLPFGSALQEEIQEIAYVRRGFYSYHATFAEDRKKLGEGGVSSRMVGTIAVKGRGVRVDDLEPGSLKLAEMILSRLSTLGHFTAPRKECGEPLFQAVPSPNRYPLGKYIVKQHRKMFDFLVLDEGHEYANGDTAQSHAAHRLRGLGIPTVLMTGSLMNGYAASLFINLWSLSRKFRAEFKRDEKLRFTERFGYHKRILTDKDRQTKEPVEFGSHSDRVERSERGAGDAPGVLPLFLFQHLLSISVTLHKADLALDLPPCRQIKATIEPSKVQLQNYTALQSELVRRVRADQFSEGMAGKLFGALAELPSYLDRATCDTGNQDDGSYAIHYPESVGGMLVAKAETLPEGTILPKEQWMLDTVRSELAEGRNVMVFSWHVNLLPRLARLLEQEFDTKVPVLLADKVAPAKREDWINKNVVNKGARIMLANPVGIQTGLNNLVYFATEVWMEDPASNPTIFRQGVGRVDRIGQEKESRIYTPVYNNTLQVQLHELLLRKVAVATATDGLDNESMLLAAGAGDDAMLTGLSIGRQLWALIQSQELGVDSLPARARPARGKARKPSRVAAH